MDYTQVSVFTTTEGIEPVGAMLIELGTGGYAVQDAADFQAFLDGKQGHWDYIDDQLMKLREAETTLTVYLPQNLQGAQMLRSLEDELLRLKALDTEGEWGRLTFAAQLVREQDWAEAWKQYYRPVQVGKRLVVCPSWEAYTPEPGQVVLQMDPGMAFGTGTHDSTRLCMELLEEALEPGMQVLDVGCGSGILAVAALLLGADSAIGVDIDEVAVRVANENACRNGVADGASFRCGSLAAQVEGVFDIVLANIVADVIIGFAPDVPRLLKPGGLFLASGIIDTRADEVATALEQAGFTVAERRASGGWVAIKALPSGLLQQPYRGV